MRFAYADPPYIGQARKHYKNDEVDHQLLIKNLIDDFPDGWALSCSSVSLHQIIPMCPSDARIMAWVKPFAIFKPGVGVAYAWEPIIVRGGRRRTRQQLTVRDWVSVNITLKKGLVGAKPGDFYLWLFDVLNAQKGDEYVELFPGTRFGLRMWRALFGLQPKIRH